MTSGNQRAAGSNTSRPLVILRILQVIPPTPYVWRLLSGSTNRWWHISDKSGNVPDQMFPREWRAKRKVIGLRTHAVTRILPFGAAPELLTLIFCQTAQKSG
jgi:hypothetical protein